MKIPILNLYYLLSYAWDRLDAADTVEVSAEDANHAADLLALILTEGVFHLLRRGVDRGYQVHDETYQGVRGRLLLGTTISRGLIGTSRTVCEVDELTHDVLHNQILKASLRELLFLEDLDPAIADRVHAAHRRLQSISEIDLRSDHFRQVQLHRNNALYGLLLNSCELLHNNLLPREGGAGFQFRDFTRDEGDMARLFQAFVRNFYHLEQSPLRVKSPRISWLQATGSTADLEMLPGMHTDVVLTNSSRTIIIDTKFYGQAFQENRGRRTVRSDHLYQIFAYVTNSQPAWPHPEGLLLYPEVQQHFRLTYELNGLRIRVASVNLARPWREIRAELLDLVA